MRRVLTPAAREIGEACEDAVTFGNRLKVPARAPFDSEERIVPLVALGERGGLEHGRVHALGCAEGVATFT